MTVITDYISISSRGKGDMKDLTSEIHDIILKHKFISGTLTVFSPGSTAGITTIGFEPGLREDMKEFLEKAAPYSVPYHHHDT